MSLRIVEIITSKENADAVLRLAHEHSAVDAWRFEIGADRTMIKILISMDQSQTLTDALQSIVGVDDKHRIILSSALATIPDHEANENTQERVKHSNSASREELYDSVTQGTQVDSTFILLVLLSTLVAAIGMLKDNVAVVIGAMVIAPLLGPNLAFAFGVALGDRALMARALRVNLIGLTITIGVSLASGLILPLNFSSHELLSRTTVDYDSVALALASGAAAVLSLSSGLSSSLVGVMVAVALLPPAAAFGLLLGAGEIKKALGAAILLAVNLVCVNLAAQIVLVWRGIRARTWWEKKEATQSIVLTVSVWGILLLILLGIIYIQSIKISH